MAAPAKNGATTGRWKRTAVLLAVVCLAAVSLGDLPYDAAADGKSSADSRAAPCCFDLWRPGDVMPPRWRPGGTAVWRDQRMHRHRLVMLDGIPLDYQGQRSPFPPTPEVVQKGGALYLSECASCHGRRGLGDGDAGKGLSPSPALIAFLQKRPMAVDAYLMWSIAEGGKPLGSDMPAFKNALTETEIWQIVAFMRAGFPPLSKIGGAKK